MVTKTPVQNGPNRNTIVYRQSILQCLTARNIDGYSFCKNVNKTQSLRIFSYFFLRVQLIESRVLCQRKYCHQMNLLYGKGLIFLSFVFLFFLYIFGTFQYFYFLVQLLSCFILCNSESKNYNLFQVSSLSIISLNSRCRQASILDFRNDSLCSYLIYSAKSHQ